MEGVESLLLVSLLLVALPILVGVGTAYLKVSIVFGVIRSALGSPQIPSGLVVMVLSASLSLFVMAPVISEVHAAASKIEISDLDLQSAGQLKFTEIFTNLREVSMPWLSFLLAHSGADERDFFVKLAEATEPINQDNIRCLLPAFVLTEVKEAFAMSFAILLPFLVIDIIVANLLVGMGMYMVSPVMIAFPIKLALFVATDAWMLIINGLVGSYGGT